jgi:hypothetical protein
MEEESFKAFVQYGDWKGSSAADRADQGGPEAWLSTKQLKQDDEFLAGIKLYAEASLGSHSGPVFVEFLLTTRSETSEVNIDNARPLPVRRVAVEMTLVEFFDLFKRFSVYISNQGILEGREYAVLD